MVTTKFIAWFDAQVAAARPRVTMEAAGYRAEHQGGNCLAWCKPTDGGSHLMICTDDNDIDGEIYAPIWLVGHHDDEGGFVELSDAFTLSDALAAAARMPSPTAVGGIGSQQSFDSVEQAVAASRQGNLP